MFAESSKEFIFQKFAVKAYFGLSLHIFQHGSSLSLENVCDSWCMHQTGSSSAAIVPLDCEQSLIFFAKLLHAKPKHASGKAARKEGVSPRRKNLAPFSNNNVVVCNRAE